MFFWPEASECRNRNRNRSGPVRRRRLHFPCLQFFFRKVSVFFVSEKKPPPKFSEKIAGRMNTEKNYRTGPRFDLEQKKMNF